MDPINRLLAIALVALAAPCAWAYSPAAPGSPHAAPAALPAAPLAFEENKGQVRTTDGAAAPDVRFRLTQGSTQVFLLDNGITYQFSRTHYPEGYVVASASHNGQHDPEKQKQLDALRKQVRLETYRMDMVLEGASTYARITTEGRSSDYTQYYNHPGSSPGQAALDVRTYTKVTYHEVYPGIDWVVYTTEKGMKYDFVVRPGADPDLVRLRFTHHEELTVDAAGNLIHGNRMGRFTEARPVSFQDGKEVATRFVLEGNHLRFAVGTFDRNRTLTIDPERIWGTYYGAADQDLGWSCAADANGNVFFAGTAVSATAIASGGHQNTFGGDLDAFLVKFNAAGTRLWGTYYGGEGFEEGFQCAADASGNVFLTGRTSSSTAIASGGHQNTLGDDVDAFLVKFSSAGTRLWGTYYGGTGYDRGLFCAVDADGNVYMCGETSSSSAMASNGHQNTYGGGTRDAFLAKFSATGTRLWGTYFGGNAEDAGYSCEVDASGNVFLCGRTASTSFIASGGHQNAIGGGLDAFLAKFNSDGTRLWGTYYGGAAADYGWQCAVSTNGDVFLAGSTASTSAIASGGHQNAYGGGDRDGFIAKFSTSGTRIWGSYYGGAGDELAFSCAADATGGCYLSGFTSSTTGIASNGHQNAYGGGVTDDFLARFGPNGERIWGTYYGGAGDEGGDWDENWFHSGRCTSAAGNVYMTGGTTSNNGIASGGHQSTFGGDWDGYLVKFGDASSITTGAIAGPFCAGQMVSVPFTATGVFNAGNTFTAQLSNASGSFASPVEIGSLSGTGSGTIEAIIPPATPGGTGYRIRVVASDPETEGDDNGADFTINAPGDACDDGDPRTVDDILDEECLCAGTPPKITGYRYWFDDDIDNATTIAVAPVPELLITDAFDAQDLDGGLRRVSVQAQDNLGDWSSPQTSLFARVDAVVSGYRYWVNDDPSNMLTGTVTPAGVVDLSAALPISGADRPFNLITIQFLDPAGVYSAPLTKAFALTHGLVSGYRYWVNDDPTTVQTVNVTPVELLDLTSPLAIGIADRSFNILTIQFRDEGGIYSVPYTTTFVRSTGPIVEYEYWIDDVIADRVAGNVGPAEVADLIDDIPTSAPPGPHVFTIRFRGESGAWSVPLTKAFVSNMVVYDCPDLEANIGDACDDEDANTENDEVNANCNCAGTPIVTWDCPDLEANIGDACDDEDANTENDEVDANCNCAGTPIVTWDCPALEANIGDACDDEDANTENDEVDANCNCSGTPPVNCTTDLDFVYQADGVDDLDWQIFEQGTNIPVQTGGGSLIGTGTEATCLPDGCFYLLVTDGGGDGIVGGGYMLKINSSSRLIDNLYGTFGEGGFTSGGTSAIDNNEGFCLPVGTDRLIVTSCDRRDWKLSPCGGEFVVANANAAVSAQYGVNNANSGYQMWWYNPNGGYSFKRFQSHSTNNGLAASATRACHFMLNGWSGNQLVEGGFYNVKVRGRVNGVYNPWGPACRLTVNSTEAQCPRTKLMDLPGNQHLSCGQSRTIGANQYVHARPVRRMLPNCNWQNANRYQFRFRIPAENVTIVKTAAVGSGNYFVNTMGLTCGKTYEVDVRVSFDGGSTWCHSSDPYGDVCLLTTTCSFGMAQEGGHTNGAGQSERSVGLYPNPNRGDQLFVSLNDLEEGVSAVNVDIYDAFGKRVAQRTMAVSDGFVNTVLDVNSLANGMYLVSITAGTAVYTERLVVQR